MTYQAESPMIGRCAGGVLELALTFVALEGPRTIR